MPHPFHMKNSRLRLEVQGTTSKVVEKWERCFHGPTNSAELLRMFHQLIFVEGLGFLPSSLVIHWTA